MSEKVVQSVEVKATAKGGKEFNKLAAELDRTNARFDKMGQSAGKAEGATASAAAASQRAAGAYRAEAMAATKLAAANARRARERIAANPKATQAQRLAAIRLEEQAVINLARVEQRSARTVSESYRARNRAQQAQHDAHMRRLSVQESATSKAGKGFGGLGLTLGNTLGPLAAVTAGTYALGAALDSVSKTALAYTNVHKNLPYAIELARDATAGLVDDMTLMRGAVSAARFEVAETAEEYATLSRGIQALSLSQGLDAEVIQEKVVRGIATRSKKLLDDIGILVDANKANEAYAQSIGKVASALTEQDRNKAYKAEVLRQMATLTEKVAIETDGAAAAYQRAAVARRNFYTELSANPGTTTVDVELIDPESDRRRAEAAAKRRRDLETWEANGSLTDKAELEELRQLRQTESKGWEQIAYAMDNRTEVADRFIDKVKELGSAWHEVNAAEYEASQKRRTFETKKLLSEDAEKLKEIGEVFAQWGSKTFERMTDDYKREQKERTKAAEDAARRRQALREAEANAGVAASRIQLEEARRAYEKGLATLDEYRAALDVLHFAQWDLNDAQAKGAKTTAELVQAGTAALQLESDQRREVLDLTERQADAERRRAEASYAALQASHSASLVGFDRTTELGAAQRSNAATRSQGAAGLTLRSQIAGEEDTGAEHRGVLAEVADNEARRDLRATQLDEEREFYEERLLLVSDDQAARAELARIEQEQDQLGHEARMDQLKVEDSAERKRIREATKRAKTRAQIYRQGTREVVGFARTMATTSMQVSKTEKDRVSQLREAGKTQNEAERQARGETLKTYGGQLVGMAIGHGAEAVGAAASFNYPKMALHLAAAGALGIAGGTLIATGNGMGAGGGGSAGGSSPTPGAMPSGQSKPTMIDSPIPPSPRPPAPGGGGESNTPPATENVDSDKPPIHIETTVQLDTETIATAVGEHNGGY